jgi:hypothetical protein
LDALLRDFSRVDQGGGEGEDPFSGNYTIAYPSKKTLAKAAGVCHSSMKLWARERLDTILRTELQTRGNIRHPFNKPTEYRMDPIPKTAKEKSLWVPREILSMPGISAEAKIVYSQMWQLRSQLNREARKKYDKIHGKGASKRKLLVVWLSDLDLTCAQRQLVQNLEKAGVLQVHRRPGKPNMYRLLDWRDPAVKGRVPIPRYERLWADFFQLGETSVAAMMLEHRALCVESCAEQPGYS